MKEEQIYLEYVSLEELQGAPRNPKDHDIGALHESIKRFDFVAPFIINENTGRLVVGHGRLRVLQQMKANGMEPPGHIVKKGESWQVPVIKGIYFRNEKEAEAYLLADNRLTELGSWHQDQLVQVLSDLAVDEKDLIGVGWDSNDIDAMLANDKIQYKEEIPETFQVIVECEAESQQIELLSMLQQKGYSCRALVS